MSLSNSRKSYEDCFKLLDEALEDERGLRIRVTSAEASVYLRMRLHQARQIDRKDNREIYKDQPDHPMYGVSVYDVLVCRLDGPYVYLDKQKVEIIGKESLSEPGLEIAYDRPKLLEPLRPTTESWPLQEREIEIQEPVPEPPMRRRV